MNILVVDRYPITRRAIADLVKSVTAETAVMEFDSAADAIEHIREKPVDLVLCGRCTGAVWRAEWLTEFVTAARPGKIIVLSPSIDPASYEHDVVAGADGHIPMTSSIEVATAAITLVMAGGQYFPPVLPGAAMNNRKDPHRMGSLSPRQLQVLTEVERGLSNKEIARKLGISLATVKLHVRAILQATGAKNRTGAVVRSWDDVVTE